MKKSILLLISIIYFFSHANAQTWEWTHPEPNGSDPAASESDDAHHVKTDAAGNIYVLGNYLHSLYLNNNFVAYGNGSYLAKYDPDGALLWYKLIRPDDATFANQYSPINANDLVVNSSGIFLSGTYAPSVGSVDIYNNCAANVSVSKTYKIGDYSFTSTIWDVGIFLVKLNTNGDLVWYQLATDQYADQSTNNCYVPDRPGVDPISYAPLLTSDPSNNLTLTVEYTSPHPGFIFNGSTIPSDKILNSQGEEIFAISFNSDGLKRWSNSAVILGGDAHCNSIVADNIGNVLLYGKAVAGSGFGSYTLSSTNNSANVTYIAKLSSSGSWQFAKELTIYSQNGFEGLENPNLMAVDNDNNIYAVLTVGKLPNGDPQYILGSQINPAFINPYLVKMDNDANLIWWKSFGTNTASNSDNYGTGICFQNNSLYVTGTIRGGYPYSNFSNLTVPSTNTSYLLEYTVAKADLDGNFQWVNRFSGGSNTGGFSVAAFSDNIYTCGYYRVSVNTLGSLNGSFNNADIYTHQIFFGKLKDQYIKVGAVSPTTLCPGATFTIPFTSHGLTLSNSNTFTVQISDANGDFSNAVNIGSVASTGPGTITATLPSDLSSGTTGYKVRIVSSDLLVTGYPYYAYADVDYTITIGDQTFYQDSDGDGFGNPAVSFQTCTPPNNYVLDNTDCDDNNIAIHLPITYYRDADSDGFGDLNTTTAVCESIPPQGYIDNSIYCDDTKKLYSDNDGDGYGSNTLVACDGVQNNTDCNDGNVNINPGAVEVCGNGVDDNCNGQIDEGCSVSPPSISINDVTVYEAQGVATLTVSLSKTNTQAIKINYTTMDGTAIGKGRGRNPAIDFVAAKRTLTIPAGSLTGTISITIINDGIAEPDEYFDVVLSIMKNVNATISDGSGRITILDGSPTTTQARAAMIEEEKLPIEGLLIESLPNPTINSFTVTLNSSNWNEKIMLRIIDITGRVIETRNNIVSGQTLKIGWNYRPGIYLVEAIQGKERKTLTLLKQ